MSYGSFHLILWVGAAPNEGLTQLHSRLGEYLATAGFAVEKHAFQPHVTVPRGNNIKAALINNFCAPITSTQRLCQLKKYVFFKVKPNPVG